MKNAAHIYLIFGDDEFPVSVKAKEVVQSLVPPEEQTFGLEVMEAKADTVDQAVGALRGCLEALQTPGFLGAGKVVWLNDANFFSDTIVARSERVKSLVVELAAIIKAGLLSGQKLVITSAKVDKRSAFYKACKANAEIQEFSIPAKTYKTEQHARERAAVELKRLELKMTQEVLHAFVERVGTESRQIANEIEKLAVFMGSRREVRLEDIDEVVCASRQLAVWDLADAVGERDLPRALKALRQLLFQKESPIGLVVSLQNRLNQLIIFREALDNGWLRLGGSEKWRTVDWNMPKDIEKMFSSLEERDPRNIHPYRAAKLAVQARKFSSSELSSCRKLAIKTHEQLVSSAVPEQLIFEILLIKLLAAGRTSRDVVANRNPNRTGDECD